MKTILHCTICKQDRQATCLNTKKIEFNEPHDIYKGTVRLSVFRANECRHIITVAKPDSVI